MNGKQAINYFGLARASGGRTPEHLSIPGYANRTPTYRGIPIVVDDNINSYVRGTNNVSDIASAGASRSQGSGKSCVSATLTP